MKQIKLLVVEDRDEDIQVCSDSGRRYQRQFEKEVEFVFCKNVDDAMRLVDNSFDGAIVDLKLDVNGNEGAIVINFIKQYLRVPVVIFTGTPQNADGDGGLIRIFKKGETSYEDLFDVFFEIYNTGVTKVLGGRGIIEQGMNAVFWNSLFPILSSWQQYAKNEKETESAILRFVISHLLELLEESEACFPEEMYLFPLNPNSIKTGQIAKMKEKDEYAIVLSPACDLVVHNGQMKTDRILLCSIETEPSLIKSFKQVLRDDLPGDASEGQKKEFQQKQHKAEDALGRLIRNSYSNYYHYLPRTTRFVGGFVNFRKVSACKKRDFERQFEKPFIQVAMTFTKDIVARFSSYYARQGQPDFDFESLLKDIKLRD